MEEMFALIDTLERWYRLALALVKGGGDDATVSEVDFGCGGVFLEGERVLHPGLIITL